MCPGPATRANNDEAAEWYLSRPDAPAAALVRSALRVREGHPLDAGELRPELAAGLIPLYRHYIDDQLRRLKEIEAPADLVAAFADWDERLG